MNDLEWNLEYDGAAPPLPEYLYVPEYLSEGQEPQQWLEPGAYLLLYDAEVVGQQDLKLPNFLVGILRIDQKKEENEDNDGSQEQSEQSDGSQKLSGSADIYSCPWKHVGSQGDDTAGFEERLRQLDVPADEPGRLEKFQLPRSDYRYYFRLASAEVYSRPGSKRLRLGFDTYKHVPEEEYPWESAQPLAVVLKKPPPRSIEALKEELDQAAAAEEKAGCPIINSLGTSIGRIYVCKLAKRYRYARVRIHSIPKPTRTPTNPTRWDECLEKVGWHVDVEKAKKGINRKPDKTWTVDELRDYHEKVLDRDLVEKTTTEPWIYNILVVGQIERGRIGQMYDYGDSSGTDRAREGAALAARAQVTVGGAKTKLERATDALYWTALHELGHMQGLYHNVVGGLMQPQGSTFKVGIKPVHGEVDKRRLIHLPDLWVRPGGVPFGHLYRDTPISVVDLLPESEELGLEVSRPSVAQGRGPRELVVRLRNRSRNELLLCPFPDETVLETGRLGVEVLTPSRRSRSVRGVRPPRELDPLHSYPLAPLETIEYRLPWEERPGFFESGQYRLRAHLCWVGSDATGRRFYRASGEVSFKV